MSSHTDQQVVFEISEKVEVLMSDGDFDISSYEKLIQENIEFLDQ